MVAHDKLNGQLWFDVGIKRYTTWIVEKYINLELWFDVGIKRYTTAEIIRKSEDRCGLMQESKDIQPCMHHP